jgi:membrane fusion protein, macrolide-specific efflux system
MKLKILAVLALALVGVGAAVYAMGGFASNAVAATQYLTSAAATGDVTDDVAATGTLQAQARYGLAFGSDPYLVTDTTSAPNPTTTWPVTDVKVQVGSTVKTGDVIAVADTSALKRDLTSAQNSLSSANVSLRAAKTSLSDAEDNDDTGQIRQAKIGLYSAENQVAQAKQTVADLKTQIAAATLTAPIDGLVTELNVAVGFEAPSGPAVVIDSAGFQITTDVVESDLADIKVGQTATITVGAVDAELTGKVTAIAPVAGADAGSGVVSYPVTVALDAAPATVRSGMSADVTITIASATNVLTVPAEALRGTDGAYSVLVLGADGTPTTQAVEVGLVTATSAEITSGLAAGQEVVTGLNTAQSGTPTTTGGLGGGVQIPGGFNGGPRPGGNFTGGGQP